jgi:hypothetical protein
MPQLKKVLRSIGQLEYLQTNDLKPYESPVQPGYLFTDSEDLINSVCKHGVVEPIVAVTDSNNPGKYLIIDGVRRWRAAVRCGHDRIPVYLLKLDLANPEHVPIIDALSITLRYTSRLMDDSAMDMRVMSRVIGFILMNIGDDALIQLKQGSIPSVAVNMLADLVGVSTSTAYRWIQRMVNEMPETLISVLRSRGLIKDVELAQMQRPQPQQQPSPSPQQVQINAQQPAQQTVVAQSAQMQQSAAATESKPVVITIETKKQEAVEVPQPPEFIMCGGNSVRRDIYDMALNDDELGSYMITLCRKGLVSDDIIMRIINASKQEKRRFIDENLNILTNRVNIPVPTTTVKRISEVASLYRTSQQDIFAKLGMLIYAVVRIIEEDRDVANRPIIAKLDEVSRYAFGELDELKGKLKSFIDLITERQ